MNDAPQDLRSLALALPETTEETHFRLPSFKVDGQGFALIQKDGVHAFLSADEATIHAAVAEDPAVFAEVRRNGKLIAVEVDLAQVSRERLEQLVKLAWRNKAPRRLLEALDPGS